MSFSTLWEETLSTDRFAITRPNGWVVSIAGSPDYRNAEEMGLDMLRSLLLRVVGLRVNSRARRAGVNYRFIFMKPLGEELAQIAALISEGVLSQSSTGFSPFPSVNLPLSILHREGREERSLSV